MLGNFFSNLPAFIFVLGVLIFIHELGHFIAAKMCGVGVLRFAIGFGPVIARFQRGETRYQIGIIPLGGYVRMVGDLPDVITGPQETDEEVRDAGEGDVTFDRSRWFIEKPLLQRAWIVFAGPLFNFLLAIIIAATSIYSFGKEEPSLGPIIGTVMNGSPADKAGLKPGDLVLKIMGNSMSTWKELASTVNNGTGEPMRFEIQRNEERKEITVIPQLKELPSMEGGRRKVFLVGIQQQTTRTEVGFIRSIWLGVVWTGAVSSQMLEQLGAMILGQRSAEDLAGPIFIFHAAGEQAAKGIESLLSFIGLLSVSLGVLNLLPIPVLDGGHLFFFFLEALFGPISVKKKESAQQIGVVLLLSLMVFAVWNDITRDPSSYSATPVWEDGDSQGKK